jgi:hypothetical protein
LFSAATGQGNPLAALDRVNRASRAPPIAIQLSGGQAGDLRSIDGPVRSARSSESFTWTEYRSLLIAAHHQPAKGLFGQESEAILSPAGDHAPPAFFRPR